MFVSNNTVNSPGYTVDVGRSVGSIPKTQVVGVHSSKDLEVKFNNLESLTDEQKKAASKVFSPYKRAQEGSQKRAKDLDAEIKDQREIDRILKESHPKSAGLVNDKGDKYVRAQVHEARHEDAIKKAIDANGGIMPTQYKQPQSEWFTQKK